MSDHTAAAVAEGEIHTKAGTAVSTPEFDRAEVSGFGQQDSHAVTAISKMLVLFFFYSLLIMVGVGLWTWSRYGQTPVHPAAHAVEEE